MIGDAVTTEGLEYRPVAIFVRAFDECAECTDGRHRWWFTGRASTNRAVVVVERVWRLQGRVVVACGGM